MYYLTLMEILGVTLYSAYLIHNYCARDVNIFVKLMALISWLINFVLLILLPLDIYITFRDSELGIISQEYYTLSYLYQFLYWSNFILCWTVIPIMQEFEDAVDLKRKDKFRRSLQNNIRFYIIISVAGLLFIVCILLTGTAQDYGLGTFLKSMANSFGVALIIILLGYSLVTVPRAHMRTANLDVQMKYLYFRTATITAEKNDAKHELEELAKKVIAIKEINFPDPRFQVYIQKCLDKIPKKMRETLLFNQSQDKQRKESLIHKLQVKDEEPEELEDMQQLYQSIRRAIFEYKRIKASWKQNCRRAYEMEDVLRSQEHPENRKIQFTFGKKIRTGKFAKELDTIEWHWFTYYKPQFKIIFSLFLGLLSILVLISEVTLFMGTGFTIFGVPIKLSRSILGIQIFSFIPLFYIAFCVYYGLFRIRIAGFYGLYSDHQTDAPSLMFATINFSRVGAPLCQNFLNMVKLHQETAFRYAMGNIELIPIFGVSITALMPCLLVILCLINYFDLYDKTMKCLGMKQFMFTPSFSDRLIYEGRDALLNFKEYFKKKRRSYYFNEEAEKQQQLQQQEQQLELKVVDENGDLQQQLLLS